MPKLKRPPLFEGGLFQLLKPFGLRHYSLCLCDDRTECFGLIHGQIGEDFAVYFDTGKVQTVDETGICQCDSGYKLDSATMTCVEKEDSFSTYIIVGGLALLGLALLG